MHTNHIYVTELRFRNKRNIGINVGNNTAGNKDINLNPYEDIPVSYCCKSLIFYCPLFFINHVCFTGRKIY